MKFCEDGCNSLLYKVVTTDQLHYKCSRCGKQYKSDDKDTLMSEQNFEKNDLSAHDKLVKDAPFDHVNPKEYIDCRKCNKKILSYSIVGENMTYIYSCTCGHSFTN